MTSRIQFITVVRRTLPFELHAQIQSGSFDVQRSSKFSTSFSQKFQRLVLFALFRAALLSGGVLPAAQRGRRAVFVGHEVDPAQLGRRGGAVHADSP